MARSASLRHRVAAVARRCRSGCRLVVTLGSDGASFTLHPSGEEIAREVGESVLRRRMVRPLGDELFGTGTSQTWGAS